MQKKYKKLIFGLIIVSLCFVSYVLNFNSVSAYGIDGINGKSASSYLQDMAYRVDLKKNEPSVMIGTIIYYILGFLGIIALTLIIAAGIMWMTAGGNEESVTKSKGLLKGAVIGTIIILVSYALTYFVVTVILEDIGPPIKPELDIEKPEDAEIPEDATFDCNTIDCIPLDEATCETFKNSSGQLCCYHAINYDNAGNVLYEECMRTNAN
ncbi:hypothetical protein COT27_02285 [Candidatus Kuenenbacteria bacterium CG08_land_8_20_14_0_20_37_23]|uniref:Uncharacterized protein n=1 Tax=Candidatus Kuenenbacteria bacterium CG08_land_8_20_14_0_20_37_23 TaxID=1974617 RepID=A0A2M6XSI0_9BACT|nr:MAG: hypothetical protein COT27_02285 [Candidatus Kuenenbacteria bacterium CG08_land_8_20_14_0_20_37_23]